MNTVLIFCLIAFALSLDYSLGLISLQAYWVDVGGANNLLGLVFGLYDGFTIIVTPLVAWLINHRYLKYKTVFIISLILNIIGNILYGFAHLAQTWIMILVGRIIAGLGAASLPVLIVYIADMMSKESQRSAVGYVKYTAALTRVVGPTLGTVLALIHLDYQNRIVDQYTLVGWIPVPIALITLVLLFCWTEDQPPESPESTENAGLLRILWIFWPMMVLGFTTTFVYWYFMGNSFLIATHHFKVVNNQHDLGNLYYSGLGAFILAFILFMCFKKYISGKVGLWVSTLSLIGTSCLYLPEVNLMFYFAVGLATFSYALLIPSINVQNNLLAKEWKDVLGKSIGVSITSLSVAQSLARFSGPASFILLKKIVDGASDCNLDNKEHYIISGCRIEGYLWSSVVFIAVSSLLMVISLIFISRKKDNNGYTQIGNLA